MKSAPEGRQSGRESERERGREERGPNFPTGIGAATAAAVEATSSGGRFPFEAYSDSPIQE